MRNFFYYMRDGENKPRVTVCLILDESEYRVVARGVAICSFKDQPIKSKGRNMAAGRARSALMNKWENDSITRWEADYVIEDTGWNFFYKSEYEPSLTDYELVLLDKFLSN